MMFEPESYVYNGVKYNELQAYMLWSFSSFDGPMSGLFWYEDQLYFGHCHQNPHAKRDRFFWLYELTENEIKWHLSEAHRRLSEGQTGFIRNMEKIFNYGQFIPFPYKEGKDQTFDRYALVQKTPIGYSRKNCPKSGLDQADIKFLQNKYCPSVNVLDRVLAWFRGLTQ